MQDKRASTIDDETDLPVVIWLEWPCFAKAKVLGLIIGQFRQMSIEAL